uniref:Putative homing endonuclease n=1 Tax=viral metagenome TaxID=1070528 RepID=A0A6M3LJT5_9ZZZZ
MNQRRELWQERHGTIPKGWVVHNLNGNSGDNREENLACVPRNPDHIGQVIAPYRERIRNLEKLLKEQEEK